MQDYQGKERAGIGNNGNARDFVCNMRERDCCKDGKQNYQKGNKVDDKCMESIAIHQYIKMNFWGIYLLGNAANRCLLLDWFIAKKGILQREFR